MAPGVHRHAPYVLNIPIGMIADAAGLALAFATLAPPLPAKTLLAGRLAAALDSRASPSQPGRRVAPTAGASPVASSLLDRLLAMFTLPGRPPGAGRLAGSWSAGQLR